jgi:hypothetical protein
MSDLNPARYLSEAVRSQIEQAYYERVTEQSKLENLIQDPGFWKNAKSNPAFFSDHSVVHVRDVARQILSVLETINGVLIPRRSADQLESFLYGYGVALAYLHDIGMRNLSPFGRKMHPEFAAQAVFNGSLDGVLEIMWGENCGNLPRTLTRLFKDGVLLRDPKIIFRELLSLSFGHSKSKIPVQVLDNPVEFRERMQFVIGHNLHDLYRRQQNAKGHFVEPKSPAGEQTPKYLKKFYSDFARESFDWMTSNSVEAQNLVSDVSDTLRALRCADALRQRGTVQKTSGGWEVFASPQTGNALFSLRLEDKLFLLELPGDLNSAGEANIASSELGRDGNLRLAFHRGAYDNQEALLYSVRSVAHVIDDILRDVVLSFWRASPVGSLKTSSEIQVFLESTDDNPHFIELVMEQLRQLNPETGAQLQIAPSLKNVSEMERDRYLQANDLNWDSEQRQAFLERVKQAGQKLTCLDPVEGFKHVKIADLQPGEYLIEAGAPSAFVYFPLGDGLNIIPLGGYQSFSIAAWIPLGSTGVIRSDVRNADVLADKKVSVLILPKEIYLRYWYAPYSTDELDQLLSGRSS